jgi:hypothetical protein
MQQENRLCAITSGTTLTLLTVQQVPNVTYDIKFLTVSPGKLSLSPMYSTYQNIHYHIQNRLQLDHSLSHSGTAGFKTPPGH